MSDMDYNILCTYETIPAILYNLHFTPICMCVWVKLYVNRPKQTGFILFPGTEHVRGSMTHLIPLHAALKS